MAGNTGTGTSRIALARRRVTAAKRALVGLSAVAFVAAMLFARGVSAGPAHAAATQGGDVVTQTDDSGDSGFFDGGTISQPQGGPSVATSQS